eukprot:3675589-Amphidinium_carterae.1
MQSHSRKVGIFFCPPKTSKQCETQLSTQQENVTVIFGKKNCLKAAGGTLYLMELDTIEALIVCSSLSQQ